MSKAFTPADTARIVARGEKLVAGLNKLLTEVRETYPDANWYLEDSNNLNLLSGESHDFQTGKQRQDRVIHTFTLRHSSGGAW